MLLCLWACAAAVRDTAFWTRLLTAVAPRGSKNIIRSVAKEFNGFIRRYNLSNDRRIAHFIGQVGRERGFFSSFCLALLILGQCAVESANFAAVEEFADGSAYQDREDLANVMPGDGVRFKGRGLIQLTGRANYRKMSLVFKRNLIRKCNPNAKTEFERTCYKSVATFPLALEVSGQYWVRRQIAGDPKSSLNLLADRDDYQGITRNINGPPMMGLQRRIQLTKRAFALLKSDTVPGTGEAQDVLPDPDFRPEDVDIAYFRRKLYAPLNPPQGPGRYISYTVEGVPHFTDGVVDTAEKKARIPASEPGRDVAYYLNGQVVYFPPLAAVPSPMDELDAPRQVQPRADPSQL